VVLVRGAQRSACLELLSGVICLTAYEWLLVSIQEIFVKEVHTGKLYILH